MPSALDRLPSAVSNDAAIRRIVRMQPAGGKGATLFPPTYRDVGHLIYTRRIDQQDIPCVRLDSIQSQANRMELALAGLLETGELKLPLVEVQFSDSFVVNSLTAPHRIYDAILRDSELDGARWLETEAGRRLRAARPENARAVFEISPTSLVFGAWYSTGINARGSEAKFERLVTSEIDGVGVQVARRAAVRKDPLNVPAEVRVYVPKGESDWYLEPVRGEDEKLYEGGEKSKPSGVVHSNILSGVEERGVTIDYAEMRQVVTLAGVRKLRFGNAEQNAAARTCLVALGVLAAVAQDRTGYALRSGCTLVPEAPVPWEIIGPFGEIEPIDIDLNAAKKAFDHSVVKAVAAGLEWNTEPIVLRPTEKLRRLAEAGGNLAPA
jgi:CRISPR-associated protein Csb1